MATVSSFESLEHPRKADLRQFALLFQPLFQYSSEEARRDAVAALSQSPNVPEAVAFFIASQPLAIAAPFLIASPCLSDELLITIARTQGIHHARTIVRREALSPAVIDALAGLRFIDPLPEHAQHVDNEDIVQDMMEAPPRPIRLRSDAAAEPENVPAIDPEDAVENQGVTQEPDQLRVEKQKQDLTRAQREEALRQTLKALDRHLHRQDRDRLGRRNLSSVQAALLVRFARENAPGSFATALADALSSSRWLAERILLDTSGQQLATTLTGLAMAIPDMIFILTRLYPHLSQLQQGEPRVARLIAALDGRDCEKRIDAWLRADRYTYQSGQSDIQPAAVSASR
ncbi:DUF2336 domain-containing protein [Agrobacterium vitis]|uniref:DUF2336 domain-containing protein n=2 Tax=Agrobacterium vitis TaxID=373 RepID=A0AAE4WI38_AGRVI|nr:DUF2336 domain-containing protein [Agrobacterium vitis]MCF1500429.1 DUF2336 domain-containing protein [Allorhizobium sp. Av2]MCM2442723.1 DUF2336 domain-containing protein [Agrobacterium vitis]MUZ60318.1 DUF2336 domain-containing protein [Agrobacterium vitis]MVA68445.1 DUF2336 domain-containing protein [Agrobacterium vitis]MVA88875.1 DUF2336 domain-containing protein [Agrobacterium vitis]